MSDRPGLDEEVPRVHEIPADRWHDPREQQPWFQRLPRHAQEEMRAKWRAAEGATEAQAQRRRRTNLRYVLEGMALLAVTEFLFSPPEIILTAAAFGAFAGGLAAWRRAGPYMYSAIAFWVYLLFFLLTPGGNIFGYIFFVGTCTAAGAIHMLRQSDGSE